jgi:hypothetical protein
VHEHGRESAKGSNGCLRAFACAHVHMCCLGVCFALERMRASAFHVRKRDGGRDPDVVGGWGGG